MFLRCCFFIRGAGGGERVGPLVSEGEDLVISVARGEGAGLQLSIFADELGDLLGEGLILNLVFG